MASTGFKLTPNQKIAAQYLYRFGNLQGIHGNTVKALINNGVISRNFNRIALEVEYNFTPDWQAWADVQFGSNDPAPTPVTLTTSQRMLATLERHLESMKLYTTSNPFYAKIATQAIVKLEAQVQEWQAKVDSETQVQS